MLDSFIYEFFGNKELLPSHPSKVTSESIFGELLWSCGYYCSWGISMCCSYLFTYLFDAQNIPFPASALVSAWHHSRHLWQLLASGTTGCSEGQRKILNDIIGKQSTTFRMRNSPGQTIWFLQQWIARGKGRSAWNPKMGRDWKNQINAISGPCLHPN